MKAASPVRILTILVAAGLAAPSLCAAPNQILGWNNLGMHCMDSDYSVFSVLPPYNTIEAQLIVNGRLVTASNGYTLSYQAVADADGSFNSTAMGKGNYYQYAHGLFGATLAAEGGLAGWNMPGVSNTPQAMLFENTNRPAAGVATAVNWFRAEGIPLSPYDDAGNKNPYPMMRLIARSNGTPIATNDIVLPVSDEMDCRACHASGSVGAAKPAGGWVWDGLPERDFRLNILRLHDEHEFARAPALYVSALAAKGFNAAGLYRGVLVDGQSVLCAACHASEALGAGSYSNTPPLTASVHGFHAHVLDPALNIPLDNAAHRSACYRCHPGSATRCLRGAMGSAVAADGSMSMQCQSCHGSMSQVGSLSRVGWFMEPACQSCHTGTATANSGQIRFTSAFTDTNGTVRAATDLTFATQPNTPAPGLSLYRFSAGHGGLQCEACHGSTHAEFPSTHRNDNVRDLALQGHTGMMIECTACHPAMPNTASGGPHGLHAIGQGWVSGTGSVTKHADLIGSLPGGVASCQPCHGLDYRGTVLSRVQADRTIVSGFDLNSVTNRFFRGAQIGCYTCHNGPGNDNVNNSVAPIASNVSTNTLNSQSMAMLLPAAGTSLTLRIVSQPANGTVALSNNLARYFPSPGFVGTDAFTFAAYDGAKNSNLATGTVAVAQGPFSITVSASVPPSYPAQWPVPFSALALPANTVAPVTFDWDFGDSSPHGTDPHPTHTYAQPGLYLWTVVATCGGQNAVDAGLVEIGAPMQLTTLTTANSLTLTWPATLVDSILETRPLLGPTSQWHWFTNTPALAGGNWTLTVPRNDSAFFRIRRPW